MPLRSRHASRRWTRTPRSGPSPRRRIERNEFAVIVNPAGEAKAGLEKESMTKYFNLRDKRRTLGAVSGAYVARAITQEMAETILEGAFKYDIPLPNSLSVVQMTRLAVGFGDVTAGGLADWIQSELEFPATDNAIRTSLRQLVDNGYAKKRENTVATGKPGPNLATYDITPYGIRLLYIAKDLIELREQMEALHSVPTEVTPANSQLA